MIDNEGFTHVAYSDEAYYSKGKYRSVSLLTTDVETAKQLRVKLDDILRESGVSEFKWKKLKSAKYYFCAEKLLNLISESGVSTKSVSHIRNSATRTAQSFMSAP